MSSIDNNLFFKFCFVAISILFGFYFLNDLDVDSQYFSNIHADEIAGNKDHSYYYGKDRIDMNYVVDSSEYFEEDNVPQNNNIINNNYNNNRNNNNNQLILQQQLEEQQVRQQQGQGQVYNQIKNKKYEFTSIESKKK